jgi:hypothetical protein
VLYSAFGLSLEANRPIPGLTLQHAASRPDIHVHFHDGRAPSGGAYVEEPYYASTVDGGDPVLQVWRSAGGKYFRLRYADDTQFVVAANGSEVTVVAPTPSTIEDAATYLLGPVLGFVMRLRGITCLHASAVAIGDRAIAIAGPAGAGKSTAAAVFASLGYPVLADDVAALLMLDGMPHVQPAYPQLRLWPDSVSMLYGTPDALPRLTPTWDKRALPLDGANAFQERPLPLCAVYVLGDWCDDRHTTVDAMTGAGRLLVLLANTYVGYLLDQAMRRQEFDSLVRLAATIPVRQVTRSGSSTDIADLCAHLIEDVKGLDVQHH